MSVGKRANGCLMRQKTKYLIHYFCNIQNHKWVLSKKIPFPIQTRFEKDVLFIGRKKIKSIRLQFLFWPKKNSHIIQNITNTSGSAFESIIEKLFIPNFIHLHITR